MAPTWAGPGLFNYFFIAVASYIEEEQQCELFITSPAREHYLSKIACYNQDL